MQVTVATSVDVSLLVRSASEIFSNDINIALSQNRFDILMRRITTNLFCNNTQEKLNSRLFDCLVGLDIVSNG